MSDQFSEWDRFYASYKSGKAPEDAFKKYKKNRKKRKGIPPWLLTPEEKLRAAYEKRVEERRVEALRQKADELALGSSLKASKTTT